MTEYEFARISGVKKRVLAERRQALRLQKGPDWTLVDGVVCYTDTGAEKIAGDLGLGLDWRALASRQNEADGQAGDGDEGRAEASACDSEAVEGQTEAVGVPAAAPPRPIVPRVWVRVTGVPNNPRVVLGVLDEKRVTVRVRHNRNFVCGLDVECEPLNNGNFFVHVGRPPRFRGDRHGFVKPQPRTTP